MAGRDLLASEPQGRDLLADVPEQVPQQGRDLLAGMDSDTTAPMQRGDKAGIAPTIQTTPEHKIKNPLLYYPGRLAEASVERPLFNTAALPPTLTKAMAGDDLKSTLLRNIPQAGGAMGFLNDPKVRAQYKEKVLPYINKALEYTDPEKYGLITPHTSATRMARREVAFQKHPAIGIANELLEVGIDFAGLMAQMKFLGAFRGTAKALAPGKEVSRLSGIMGSGMIGGEKAALYKLKSGVTVGDAYNKAVLAYRGGRAALMGLHGVVTTKGELDERVKAGAWRAMYNATPIATAAITKNIPFERLPDFFSVATPVLTDIFLNSVLTTVTAYKDLHKEAGGFNMDFWANAIPQFAVDVAMSLSTRNMPSLERNRMLKNSWAKAKAADMTKLSFEDYQKQSDMAVKALDTVTKEVMRGEKDVFTKKPSVSTVYLTPKEMEMETGRHDNGKFQVQKDKMRVEYSVETARKAKAGFKTLKERGVGVKGLTAKEIEALPLEIQKTIYEGIKDMDNVDDMANFIHKTIFEDNANTVYAMQQTKGTGQVDSEGKEETGKVIYFFRGSMVSNKEPLTADKLAQRLSQLGLHHTDLEWKGHSEIGAQRALAEVLTAYEKGEVKEAMSPIERRAKIEEVLDTAVKEGDSFTKTDAEAVKEVRSVVDKVADDIIAGMDKGEGVKPNYALTPQEEVNAVRVGTKPAAWNKYEGIDTKGLLVKKVGDLKIIAKTQKNLDALEKAIKMDEGILREEALGKALGYPDTKEYIEDLKALEKPTGEEKPTVKTEAPLPKTVSEIQIISGGQTGADRGGLEGAKKAGIKTGGTAPYGWRTESGPDLSLKDMGLKESGDSNYKSRTIENIKNSDGTVIFADKLQSAGTKMTINIAKENNKPYIINPTAEQLKEFASGKRILNIAGNRESVSPGIQKRVSDIISQAFSKSLPKRSAPAKDVNYIQLNKWRDAVNTDRSIPVERTSTKGVAKFDRKRGVIEINLVQALGQFQKYIKGTMDYPGPRVVALPKGLTKSEFFRWLIEHERVHALTGIDGSKIDENIADMLALERIGRMDLAKMIEERLPESVKKAFPDPMYRPDEKDITGTGKATEEVDKWIAELERDIANKEVSQDIIASKDMSAVEITKPMNPEEVYNQVVDGFLMTKGVTNPERYSMDDKNLAIASLSDSDRAELFSLLMKQGYVGIAPEKVPGDMARPEDIKANQHELEILKAAGVKGDESDRSDQAGEIRNRQDLSEVKQTYYQVVKAIENTDKRIAQLEYQQSLAKNNPRVVERLGFELEKQREAKSYLEDQEKSLLSKKNELDPDIDDSLMKPKTDDYDQDSDYAFRPVKNEETPAVGKDGKDLQKINTEFKTFFNMAKTYGWYAAVMNYTPFKPSPAEMTVYKEQQELKAFKKPNAVSGFTAQTAFESANAREKFQFMGEIHRENIIKGVMEWVFRDKVLRHASPQQQREYAKSYLQIMQRAAQEIAMKDSGKLGEHMITMIGAGGVFRDAAEAQAFLEDFNRFKHLWNKDYKEADLLKERPEKAFYNLLPTHLQYLVEAEVRDVLNPLRSMMVEKGLMSDSKAEANVIQGFMNRLTRKPLSQMGKTGGEELIHTQKVMGQKYPTYSEYYKEATSKGLIPIDRFDQVISSVIADYNTRMFNVDQLNLIKMLPHPELRMVGGEYKSDSPAVKPNMRAVEYASRWDKDELTRAGYRKMNTAEGLSQFYRGHFEVPWVHNSVFATLKDIYEPPKPGAALKAFNRVNGWVKRLVMWTPALYLPQIASSGSLWSVKTAKATAGEFIKLFPNVAKTMKKMAMGQDTAFSNLKGMDPERIALMQKHGSTAFNFSQIMNILYDSVKSEENPILRSEHQKALEFVKTRGGVDKYIFDGAVSKIMYQLTNSFYERFAGLGVDKDTAMKRAVKFANDISGLASANIYGKSGPMLQALFFARNFTMTFLRQVTGALGPMAHRDWSPGGMFNSLTHSEVSRADMKALQPFYVRQLAQTVMAKFLLMNLMQFGWSFLNEDEDERGKFAFQNEKGRKMQVKTPWRTENNDPVYLDMLIFREANQIAEMIPGYGRGAGYLFKSKLSWAINVLSEQFDNQDWMGNSIYEAGAPGFPWQGEDSQLAMRGKHLAASVTPTVFRSDIKQVPGAAAAQMAGISVKAGSPIPESQRKAVEKGRYLKSIGSRKVRTASIEELRKLVKKGVDNGGITIQQFINEVKRRKLPESTYFRRHKRDIIKYENRRR
jgi:hypothetical protein